MKFVTQTQVWVDFLRHIIMTDDGAGVVVMESNYWNVERHWYIHSLYVLPGHRRQGIARALMREAHQWLRWHKAKAVWIEWEAKNTPAAILNWYERLGYEEKCFDARASLMCKSLKGWQ